MSHDIQAVWAASEIANLIMSNQTTYFGSMGTTGEDSQCMLVEKAEGNSHSG